MSELNKNSITYNGYKIDETSFLKRLLARIGRKLTYAFMHNYGESQNSFNMQTALTIDKLGNELQRIKESHGATEEIFQKIDELYCEFEAVLNDYNKLKQRINHDKNFVSGTKELTAYGYAGLDKRILSLKNAADDPRMVQSLLDDVANSFIAGAKNELHIFDVESHHNTIAIVCSGFYEFNEMEAIKNEVYDLYVLLREKTNYNVKIISIEYNLTEYQVQNDVHYIPYDNPDILNSAHKKLNPKLYVLCESTVNILFSCGGFFLQKHCVLKLSGQNPLQEFTPDIIAELIHFNDYGLHKYTVQSAAAASIISKAGLRPPAVSYPVIDIKKDIFYISRHSKNINRPIVGFASSPVSEEQVKDRGTYLLAEFTEENPDVDFIILWRNPALPVPSQFLNSPNCTVHYGKYDMRRFYSDIDALIIPYISNNYNHACSLSALEAMLNGIPVIATKAAGVSDIIANCEMGAVADENTPAALRESLENILINYRSFFNTAKSEKLMSYLNSCNFIEIIDNEMKKDMPSGVPTVSQWDHSLRQEGGYLVKGVDAIKKYYSSEAVAAGYNGARFTTYPENCFDVLERKSVSIIIDDYFNQGAQLKILDIACGDGRILSEDIKYGECTAIDNSAAMLSIVQKRFAGYPVTLLNGDFFNSAIEGRFDVITVFRYLRHFEFSVRRQFYTKIKENMAPGGILIFDVPNINFEINQRKFHGWGNYNIYDVFWHKDDFISEMEKNGFSVRYIIPAGQNLVHSPHSDFTFQPMTWTAAVCIT